MKKTYLKRFTGIILTTALLFSGVGCGETNTVVDDYGSSSESTEASDKGTSTDSQSVSTGNDKTLKDIYGDKVYVNNDYEVGDVTIKGQATFVVPEQEYLNAYNMQACDDGLKDEDIVVKALLGDTAEKLESIKYENSSDYMTLLYKYRSILLAKITREVLGDYLEHLEAEVRVVDSFENPFGAEVLSDENLGIPAK